ncbi:lipoprotein [Firmicutes bacterium CAG:884]|nr:lipoprotein [Firmicutes bacterium CAG:884]
MKNGNGVTSSDRMYFWKDNYRPYIRTINFGSDLSNLPSSCTEENLCFDVTSDGSKKKVYGYLIDSGLNFQVGIDENNNPIYHALYNLYIVSGAPIFAPQDCSLFFAGFNNLVNINYNDNFNTSKVTNMSYMFLPIMPGDWSNVVTLTSSIKNVKPSFLNNKRNDIKTKLLSASSSGADIIFGHYYSSLTELNLSSFNTKNVVNMKYMFAKNNTLISLNLSNFNTINVENLEGLFYKCIGISELNLKSFNTSSVTNMSLMFSGCSSITSLDLSNFNTSSVTNMSLMFDDCSSLTSLDLSSFNTSNVTNMSFMFLGCSSLTTLNLCGFNTSNVTNMSFMFLGCSSLTTLNLCGFNTSNVTNMSFMFLGCSSLTTLNLCGFNTSNVTNMSFMFLGCSSLTTLDLSSFNTSNVTNMSFMFLGCSSLTTLNLCGFNTSNVTNMSSMFCDCSSLTSLDLSSFNTSNVTKMSSMFYNCLKLQTQINIMNAGTTSYSGMFNGALTDPSAYVILGYTTDTQSIAEAMKVTASTANQSKVTLKQI